MRTSIVIWACLGLVAGTLTARGAEAVKLSELPAEDRAFRVKVKMELSGKLEIPTRGDKPQISPLSSKASIAYEERRLPGTGRDASAFRSVRMYENPRVDIQTGDFKTFRTLRQSRRLVVAEGLREGVRQFSPAGPLTYDEVDLLQFPGDSLAMLALLHEAKLEVGEVWKPSDWVMQYVAGIEASEKTALNCKLDSVRDGVARVEFSGEISGADLGARCALKISGHYLFDLKEGYLKHAEISQEDVREAGVLHPALSITVKAVMDRELLPKPAALTDEVLNVQPLDATPANLLLIFEQPEWGARFYYERHWHVFHQTPNAAVLRMLQQGGVVAQFNLSLEPPGQPGEHATPEEFKSGIQKSLGANFQEILQAEEVTTDKSRYHYRVLVAGGVQRTVPKQASKESNQKTQAVSKTDETPEMEVKFVPIQWIYHLLAAPDGRQAVLTFILESEQVTKFRAEDAAILANFQFVPRK